MRKNFSLIITYTIFNISLFVISYLGIQTTVLANNALDNGGFEGTWVKPKVTTIPNTAEGDLIRYGKTLLSETYKYLGSESVIGKQYTGNKLACANCHLNTGTVAYAGPWSVVYLKYGDASLGAQGLFSSRRNEYRTIQVRINGCMKRSMSGKPLPFDSEEMKAMIAYFKWLSTGMKVDNWTQVVGTGNIKVPDLTRAADPVRGKTVFGNNCARCHGSDGQGLYNAQKMAYKYPALWGPNSFNTGAGMNRLRTGVRFVKGNMPYAVADPTDPNKQLSAEDAWDVMAYVLSQDRPVLIDHTLDWTGIGPDGLPNWMRKRVDAPYPNYYPRADRSDDLTLPPMFPAAQHKYGPYQDMLRIQAEIRQAYEATLNP